MLRSSSLVGLAIWVTVACGGNEPSTVGGNGGARDAAVGDAAAGEGVGGNAGTNGNGGSNEGEPDGAVDAVDASGAGAPGVEDGGGSDPNDGGSTLSDGGLSMSDASLDAGVDGAVPGVCVPLDTRDCYDGDAATEDVGVCHGGTQTCASDGSEWGPCEDQVTPEEEICGNGDDDDCDNNIDESEDLDGDGWGRCDNDCCDVTGDCPDPSLQNPGAYEIVGNELDDDCDLATSDSSAVSCSTGTDFAAVGASDLAAAMDLCQTTTLSPALAQKKWGVISAQQLNADGSTPASPRLTEIQDWQSAILTGYGTVVVPQAGDNMVGLSTGKMRDVGDAGYAVPNAGTDFMSDGSPPAAYLAQHGGVLPNAPSCPAGAGANDSVNLRLTIRVPTNVSGLRYRYRFFSSEYWSYSCTAYNDFSLALLTSTHDDIPDDRNIAFDSVGNPLSVNINFFEVCQPKTGYTCPLGTGDLAGTGMDADDPIAGGTQPTGGGTAWQTVQAPVVPGETVVLDLMIFDVGDNTLDSVLLLDDFEWVVP
ncbi:MAG TPA: choice-of-anchor L domain-containing protein [Polyangiaceae bacterium]|nr:choice-of-anchor L domain-containing protein [Polyangiaceae bacterium]